MIKQFFRLGFRYRIHLMMAKRKYLNLIIRAKAIQCSPKGFEVHMLLQSKRVLEGAWAFYSFAKLVSGDCKLIVHDDGSLSASDIQMLKGLFLGCVVINRDEADKIANNFFENNNLKQCRKFRESFVLGLKLFDVVLFAESTSVMLLDSDVLFFKKPVEIIAEMQATNINANVLFMKDVCDGYSLSRLEILKLVGVDCAEAINTGVALVSINKILLSRIEEYLNHSNLWLSNSSVHHFAEQTLWAIEMSLAKAKPLPRSYAIAPKVADVEGMVCCHYCGGPTSAYLFYTNGIPLLAENFKQAGILQYHA